MSELAERRPCHPRERVRESLGEFKVKLRSRSNDSRSAEKESIFITSHSGDRARARAKTAPSPLDEFISFRGRDEGRCFARRRGIANLDSAKNSEIKNTDRAGIRGLASAGGLGGGGVESACCHLSRAARSGAARALYARAACLARLIRTRVASTRYYVPSCCDTRSRTIRYP